MGQFKLELSWCTRSTLLWLTTVTTDWWHLVKFRHQMLLGNDWWHLASPVYVCLHVCLFLHWEPDLSGTILIFLKSGLMRENKRRRTLTHATLSCKECAYKMKCEKAAAIWLVSAWSGIQLQTWQNMLPMETWNSYWLNLQHIKFSVLYSTYVYRMWLKYFTQVSIIIGFILL